MGATRHRTVISAKAGVTLENGALNLSAVMGRLDRPIPIGKAHGMTAHPATSGTSFDTALRACSG